MRVAFTIALNAKHHLEHNNYADQMAEMFDYWVIVEGAAGHTGSTWWCKDISEKYQKYGASVDGTVEYLEELSDKYSNVEAILHQGPWANKDAMVNVAVDFLRTMVMRTNLEFKDVYLWQVDADEQFTEEVLSNSENYLESTGSKTGEFLANFYVGKNLLAMGEWGEGHRVPARRVWSWKGEYFQTHEPPELVGGNGKTVLCPDKFTHYAYYYEKDVEFKNVFYNGHEDIYERWLAIQQKPASEFPIPISELITGHWGQSKTEIVAI